MALVSPPRAGGQAGLAAGGGYAAAVGPGRRRDEDDDEGILDTIGHVFSQGAADIKDIALGIPAGLVETGKAVGALATGDVDPLVGMGKEYLRSLEETIRHPLRHPGYTVLNLTPFVSGGASAVVRLGAAGRAAAAGQSASRAFLTNPAKANQRVITGPTGATARGQYSRSGLGFTTQRAIDRYLQTGQLGSKRETALNKRIAKWQTRDLRVREAILNANTSKLWEQGRKLSNEESRALRFVAEKLPIERRLIEEQARIDRAQARVGQTPGADKRTVDRLRERQQWGRDALQFLDLDEEGIPSFKATPEGERLARFYSLMEQVVGDREGILKGLGLMDDARLHEAQRRTSRYVMGAQYVRPTAARRGQSPEVVSQRRYVARLQKQFDKLVERERPGTYKLTPRNRSQGEAIQYLAQLTMERDKALKTLADQNLGPVDMSEVRRRNRENARARRQEAGITRSGKRSGASAWKSKRRPTVWEERYRLMEARVQESIERNPDHPVSKRWREREETIAQLTDALNPDPETIFGEGPRAEPFYGTVTEPEFRQRSARLERLGGGLSIAKDELARREARAAQFIRDTGVVGAEDIDVPEGALHVGYPRQRKLQGFAPPRASSTGTLGHTRDASLRPSKGTAIEFGLDEPNIAKVLASRGRGANKLAMLAERIETARPGGTLAPTRKDDVFLWSDDEIISQKQIPAAVRDYLDDPEKFNGKEEIERTVMNQARDLWVRTAGNGNWELDPELLEELTNAAEQGRGVFVQRSLLGDLGKPLPNRIQGKPASILDTTNNIQKSLLIYLKASYPLIQALSNAGMNIIQQGFATPRNIAHTGNIWRTDPELTGQINDVMGTGALMNLAFEGTGRAAGATQKLAHWMSSWVDGPARMSAFVHEARQAGFKSPEQIKSLLNDESKADQLAQVAQRAKEAIVDYSDLGDAERHLIRRIFFVYPWLKGSTKYTAHFLRDHPVQAAALANIGAAGTRASAEQFGELPSYLQGVFKAPEAIPYFGGRMVNPSGVNQFQTPASIAAAVAGLLSRQPSAPQLSQFLTPGLATATALATGRNSLGLPLEGGSLPATLRELLVEPAPVVRLARAGANRAGITSESGTWSDILDRLFGETAESKSFPDPNDPLGRFFLGGLYPREYSEAALARAAGLERSGR